MKTGRKLKVLHLSSHLDPGGVTSYIRLLARTMASQGHEATVLSGGGYCRVDFEREGIATIELPIRTKNEFHPRRSSKDTSTLQPQTVSLVVWACLAEARRVDRAEAGQVRRVGKADLSHPGSTTVM